MESKVIIMLTHNDITVTDALEVFESCKDLPVQFWGFKNVGLEKREMGKLVEAMKAAGKETFLEVVSYTEEACMEGAKIAVELGFDHLLGTVFHQPVFDYILGQDVKFMPFCGKVHGSPSVLEGTIDEIIEDADNLLAKGVYGIDILAFRHKEGVRLAEEYCRRIKKPAVVAGSINNTERIAFINRINPWAFTIGSAIFTGNFASGENFRKNLEAVIEYMDGLQ